MRKQLILSLFLITTLIGQAVALPIIPILIGVGISTGIIGYYLGVSTINQSYVEELEEKYQQAVQQNKEDNDENIRQLLFEIYARDSALYKVGQDFGEYTKNYAWALAKWTALKALSEGKDVEVAKMKARTAVMDYYENITKTLVNNFNATISTLNVTLNEYKEKAGLSEIYVDTENKIVYSDNGAGLYGVKYDPSQNKWVVDYRAGKHKLNVQGFELSEESKTIAGKSYTYNILKVHVKGSYYKSGWKSADWHVKVLNIQFAGSEVFNINDFYNAVNQIDSAYNSVINDLDAYVESLASAYPSINLTDFIDPYIIASQLHSDLQNYNYSGYVAGELALLGLNTHGLNKYNIG